VTVTMIGAKKKPDLVRVGRWVVGYNLAISSR